MMVLSVSYHYTREGRCVTVRSMAELFAKNADFDEVDGTVDAMMRLGLLENNRGRNRVPDGVEYMSLIHS